MSLNEWTEVLMASFENVLTGFLSFVPTLIMALFVFVIGWWVAGGLAKVVEQIIKSIKLDKALAGAGLDSLISKSGFKLDSGKFLGELVKWFTIIVFLITVFDILGLQQVNDFLTGVVIGYIPQVIASVLILLVAVLIADALGKTVVASAKAADIDSANFLGSVTKWAIWVFAALAALVQLGIGAIFIQTLFTGVVVAISIAFGLAFGLGGRDAAADAIAKAKKEITSHRD
jgi:small-conductance mechanosensitive channel